jgi:hypothetical protein
MDHISLGLIFLISVCDTILCRRKAVECIDGYFYIDKLYAFWCLVYGAISVITFTRIIWKLFF